MRYFIFLAAILMIISPAFCAINTEELVPFVLPWDDASPGPTNLSFLLPKPADKIRFMNAKQGHLYAGNTRIRLFGVNFTTTACFPEHRDAEKIAARLAKFGINCVRFHHMDASWLNDVIFENDKHTINQQRLEKLDYFIYQLKKRGIYTNINLHVSREYPGTPVYEGRPGFCKGLDIFYPQMIDMQKEYARDLLMHYNPYTKTRYVDEPAIAIVEINNENGLMFHWASWSLDTMPQEYASVLSLQWNQWLKRKYGSDANLKGAWRTGAAILGPEMLINPTFRDNRTGWVLEKYTPEAASMDFGQDREAGKYIRVQVAKIDGTSWHIQFHQPFLTLRKNKTYTLSVRARADKHLRLAIAAQQYVEPYGISWLSGIDLGTEWIERKMIFQPGNDDDKMRITFSNLGAQLAAVDFAEVSLKEGASYNTPTGKLGSFRFIRRSEIDMLSPSVRRDWLQFLCDTETNYWTGMKRYLAKGLGFKAIIVGTACPYSPTTIQSRMDAIDAHSYWQHPQFPGVQWDAENWIVPNLPMAGRQDGGTLGTLGVWRALGKPYIVTEYNNSAPNTYSAEGFLLLAIYAGLQDWDGIFAFDYLSSCDSKDSRMINGFFDIGQHPTKMASLVAASAMFIRGDIKPISEVRTVQVNSEAYSNLLLKYDPWLTPDKLGFVGRDILRYKIGQGPGKRSVGSLTDNNPVDHAGEMIWDTAKKNVILDTPSSKIFVGNCNDEIVKLGNVDIQINKTLQNWAAITLTSIRGKSISTSPITLLTATGYAQNTGMKWKDESMSSVGSNWGTSPSLVECITARISMPARDGLEVWSLDECGQRSKPVKVVVNGNRASFTISPEYKTIWYEIEAKK